jgi:hypothetical protein
VTAKLAMKDPWRLLEPVLFCHQHLHQPTAARHQRLQIAGPLVGQRSDFRTYPFSE